MKKNTVEESNNDSLEDRLNKIPDDKKIVKTISEEEYMEMIKNPNVKDLGVAVGTSTMTSNMEWVNDAMPPQ